MVANNRELSSPLRKMVAVRSRLSSGAQQPVPMSGFACVDGLGRAEVLSCVNHLTRAEVFSRRRWWAPPSPKQRQRRCPSPTALRRLRSAGGARAPLVVGDGPPLLASLASPPTRLRSAVEGVLA